MFPQLSIILLLIVVNFVHPLPVSKCRVCRNCGNSNLAGNLRNLTGSTNLNGTDGLMFRLEMVLLPASILAIPLVIICFLLCTCFCGRKEERARIPEVWYIKKPRKRLNTASELEFGEDYVKRKDSQKTRFNTRVTIIEGRRESALTVASNKTEEESRPNESSAISTEE